MNSTLLSHDSKQPRQRLHELPKELSALLGSEAPITDAMSAKVDALIADMRNASADIRRLLAE
jgi:hypothetical protein